MPKELAFKIGADPEFNITMFDKKISARKIIESLFKKDDVDQDGGDDDGGDGFLDGQDQEYGGNKQPEDNGSPE